METFAILSGFINFDHLSMEQQEDLSHDLTDILVLGEMILEKKNEIVRNKAFEKAVRLRDTEYIFIKSITMYVREKYGVTLFLRELSGYGEERFNNLPALSIEDLRMQIRTNKLPIG